MVAAALHSVNGDLRIVNEQVNRMAVSQSRPDGGSEFACIRK